MKSKNKIIILVMVVVLALGCAAAAAVAMTKHPKKSVSQATQTEDQEDDCISYNGKKYRKKENIRTYLFMGIDKDGPVAPAEDSVSGGQSDAMFLIIMDSKEKKISLLSINRNTMTDIDVYDKDGNFLETTPMQICLQHGFGDGMRTSCQRSVDAVSNLLYGQSIDGYLSLNMDGMVALNDAVGGVTVNVLQDLSDPSRNVDLHQGETVTLNGNEAYVYLRKRDINEFDSATLRLQRQMQYIQSFVQQVKEGGADNTDMLLAAYNSVSDYIVTNTDMPGLLKKVMTYEYNDSDMYTIPGETKMGDTYEEYEINQNAFYELVLQLFYEEAE